jgi:hypothetical protein
MMLLLPMGQINMQIDSSWFRLHVSWARLCFPVHFNSLEIVCARKSRNNELDVAELLSINFEDVLFKL